MSDLIIVDGFMGSHARWETLRKVLEVAGHRSRIWRYDSSGRTPLEAIGTALASELRALDRPFHLVGYSMGGLISREALRQAPDLPLKHAAFLHSPHGGSVFAHLLPLPACRDMRPGSPFLRRLNDHPWEYPTLVSWCLGDLIVVPGVSANWARATRTIRSRVPAHIWPVFSRQIHRQVVDFLPVMKQERGLP